MEKALAHISEDGTRTQTVYEHLSGTARLAGAFAAPFGAKEEAEYAAWLHDIGKYSAAFQQRLAGGAATDHSTAGAQEAMKGCMPHVQAAFAVAGHHTGLPDGGNKRAADSADGTLFGRLKKPVEPYDGWREVTLPQSAPPDWANRDPLDFAFFTRMLYSCLVDADFIDTETFMNGQAAPRGNSTALSSLLEKVRTKAAGYLAAQSTLPVSSQRNAVLRACMEKGAHGAPGLYTLTVPTGGGKTFASLAFALEQAAAQGMKRVIYVIPYMSIYVKEGVPLNRSDAEALEHNGLTPKDDLKKAKKSDPDIDRKLRDYMCEHFYDIRTFGAVMTTFVKGALNCGQVRGPVQLSFARSVDPIVPQEVTITRVAITTEADAEKKNSEMGNKHIVPYGLYRAEGYVSANLARKTTGFSEEDLQLLWQAILNMFENDHSAARGKMAVRELIVFKHDSELGNAPAYKLFDAVTVAHKAEVVAPRSYQDYTVTVADTLPEGVHCERFH